MTVYFHGSFGLNREYMAGVLATSLKNPSASADDIAAPFGYKAPFVGRYKSWLHKTGICAHGGRVQLTPMGEVIWSHDPKLQSALTQWFMHHELCTDPGRAEAWHFFEHEFLPTYGTFSPVELEDALAMKLMSHHPRHFGRGASMIKVIARKIIQCYTTPEGLGGLEILAKTSPNQYSIKKANQLGPWESEAAFAKAYKY